MNMFFSDHHSDLITSHSLHNGNGMFSVPSLLIAIGEEDEEFPASQDRRKVK